MTMRRSVRVMSEEISSVSDVMQLLSKLSYNDLLTFAGLVDGDVDKISDGVEAFLQAETDEMEGEGE